MGHSILKTMPHWEYSIVSFHSNGWLRGVVVSTLVSINEVALHWARLPIAPVWNSLKTKPHNFSRIKSRRQLLCQSDFIICFYQGSKRPRVFFEAILPPWFFFITYA